MDLGLFATQIIQTGQKGNALSGSGFFSANGALGGAGNIDFWDAILGNIAEAESGEEKLNSGDTTTKDQIKKETVDLALLQLALLGQDPDQNIDEKLKELKIERISQNPENRVEQLKKLINHLTSGLPAESENGDIEQLVSRLTKRLEKLESKLDAFRTGDFGEEGAPFKLLIATGLNPAQLTKITQRIEEVETKLGRELTVEDLIAGVGNIIPAPGDDDHEFSTTDTLGIIIEKTEEEIEVEKQQEEEKQNQPVMAADETHNNAFDASATLGLNQANAQNNNKAPASNNNVNLQNVVDQLQTLQGTSTTMPEDALNPALPQQSMTGEEFRNLRSNAEFNALFNSVKNIKSTMGQTSAPNIAAKATLPAHAAVADINLPMNRADVPNALALLGEALGFDIHTGTPFNATLQAAHATSASIQAGQAHPATQTVAAQVSKAAQNGDSRSITLQLDPPDLGRVEVRLEFGHEKTVKAHLVIEKPETYLMLQRDAGALERALQDAGLDANSDSLNYEMAADDYAFNSNRDGQSGGGSAGASTEGEDEIIETTMTWDVDPETGHVHYSILA